MQLSLATIHCLATLGDQQTKVAYNAWLRLADYQQPGSHLVIQCWYNANNDWIDLGLTQL